MQTITCRSTAPILVLDSGVGGLSVVAEIRQHCPQLPITYLADNAALPYGNKSEPWLQQRIVTLARHCYQQHPFQLIVVACNTASTTVLPVLRKAFTVPVIGVVPAIKPAAQLSQTHHIGLLATPGTIKRPYTAQLIDDFARHCTVTSLGTTVLVTQAERKLTGLPVDMTALTRGTAPLFTQPELDTVVLGCTHFPLLRTELAQLAPRPIHWVDSGQAVARRVAELTQHKQEKRVRQTAYVTEPGDQPHQLITVFGRFGFNHVKPLGIE